MFANISVPPPKTEMLACANLIVLKNRCAFVACRQAKTATKAFNFIFVGKKTANESAFAADGSRPATWGWTIRGKLFGIFKRCGI